MPMLTDFLSVKKIVPKQDQQRKCFDDLNKQHKVVTDLKKTFNVKIPYDSTIRDAIQKTEKETILKLFGLINKIPKKFEISCLGNELDYVGNLNNISKYPFVSVQQLKEIADALSFVILPIEYVDIEEIFKMYTDLDINDEIGWYTEKLYSKDIKMAYESFCRSVKKCVKDKLISPQNFYILAPLSFYNAWNEVKSEETYPKYFSKELSNIGTIIEMNIPVQRNFYQMIKKNNQNIQEMKKTMDNNFQALGKAIENCHQRIGWIERIVNGVNLELGRTKLNLEKLSLKQVELEKKLYCLLDPIIFSLDAKVDISSSEADNNLARVGLCFGPEMPVDFFVANGLTSIKDKRFEEVTKIMHPRHDRTLRTIIDKNIK